MEPEVDALDAYSRAVTTVAASLLPSVASSPAALSARLGQRRGLRLVEVMPGSPAAQAGSSSETSRSRPVTRQMQGVQDVQRLVLGSSIGTRLPIPALRRGALVDVTAVPTPLE